VFLEIRHLLNLKSEANFFGRPGNKNKKMINVYFNVTISSFASIFIEKGNAGGVSREANNAEWSRQAELGVE
jgi:hypothetical protein